MEKQLIDFSNKLKEILKDNLKSFIVYGSAATGEHYKDSDYNTLIILETIDTSVMKSILKPVSKWMAGGNPPPLMFTKERLLKSKDVFPMEFFDIKENHLVVFGEDLFSSMEIHRDNLRLETEREVKTHIIRLRQAYIAEAGKPDIISRLLCDSISSVSAILKGVLRIHNEDCPKEKHSIIEKAADKAGFNKEVLLSVLRAKEGKEPIKKEKIDSVFDSYASEIEKIADAVDRI